MKIVFTRDKHGGDAHSVRLIRDDGTQSWTPMTPFFVEHDLTHYAVETTLGLKDAFWGLTGQGWEIADFEKRQADSLKVVSLPNEAYFAEGVVGIIQVDQREGPFEWSRFQEVMADYYGTLGIEPPTVTKEQVNAIRELRNDLFARWIALPAGGTIELEF